MKICHHNNKAVTFIALSTKGPWTDGPPCTMFLSAKGSRISPVLNKVTLMGISNDECKKIYGRKKIIESIICVKSVNSNGAGTCQV